MSRRGCWSALLLLTLGLGLGLVACDDDDDEEFTYVDRPVQVRFEPTAAATDFYAIPYPNDLRTNADGSPDLSAFPNPDGNPNMTGIVTLAESDRTGFSQNSVALFALDGNIALTAFDGFTARNSVGDDSPVSIVSIDPDSDDYGRRYAAQYRFWQTADTYSPGRILAVAPYPGITLREDRRYAVLLRTIVTDQVGTPIGPAPAFFDALNGTGDPEAAAVYAPLRDYLDDFSIDPGTIAGAAVFTTGNPARTLLDLYDGVKAGYDADINQTFRVTRTLSDPTVLVLEGTIDVPQFREGTQPFNTGGNFLLGRDGLPIRQGTLEVPVVITLPQLTGPQNHVPLVFYIHGSGGVAAQSVDRGRRPAPGAPREAGEGPAYELAREGIATVSMAMPMGPERFPGAGELDYINFGNLPAIVGHYYQGTVELGLLLELMEGIVLDSEDYDGRPGVTVTFDIDDRGMAFGQSQGGMFLALWAALEPELRAVFPSGVGAVYSVIFTTMEVLPAPITQVLNLFFGIANPEVDHLHPTLAIAQQGLGIIDPAVFAERTSERPFPGHPTRSVFFSAGYRDLNFPELSQTAFTLAHGMDQAGDRVYRPLIDDLEIIDRDELIYPVTENFVGTTGEPATKVIVQYREDGIMSGHHVNFQLDAPKSQYRRFFRSFLDDGVPTVFAPE